MSLGADFKDIHVMAIASQLGIESLDDFRAISAIQDFIMENPNQQGWVFRSPQEGVFYWIHHETQRAVRTYPLMNEIKDFILFKMETTKVNQDDPKNFQSLEWLKHVMKKETGEEASKASSDVAKKLIQAYLPFKKELDERQHSAMKALATDPSIRPSTFKLPRMQDLVKVPYNMRELTEKIEMELTKKDVYDILFHCKFNLKKNIKGTKEAKVFLQEETRVYRLYKEAMMAIENANKKRQSSISEFPDEKLEDGLFESNFQNIGKGDLSKNFQRKIQRSPKTLIRIAKELGHDAPIGELLKDKSFLQLVSNFESRWDVLLEEEEDQEDEEESIGTHNKSINGKEGAFMSMSSSRKSSINELRVSHKGGLINEEEGNSRGVRKSIKIAKKKKKDGIRGDNGGGLSQSKISDLKNNIGKNDPGPFPSIQKFSEKNLGQKKSEGHLDTLKIKEKEDSIKSSDLLRSVQELMKGAGEMAKKVEDSFKNDSKDKKSLSMIPFPSPRDQFSRRPMGFKTAIEMDHDQLPLAADLSSADRQSLVPGLGGPGRRGSEFSLTLWETKENKDSGTESGKSTNRIFRDLDSNELNMQKNKEATGFLKKDDSFVEDNSRFESRKTSRTNLNSKNSAKNLEENSNKEKTPLTNQSINLSNEIQESDNLTLNLDRLSQKFNILIKNPNGEYVENGDTKIPIRSLDEIRKALEKEIQSVRFPSDIGSQLLSQLFTASSKGDIFSIIENIKRESGNMSREKSTNEESVVKLTPKTSDVSLGKAKKSLNETKDLIPFGRKLSQPIQSSGSSVFPKKTSMRKSGFSTMRGEVADRSLQKSGMPVGYTAHKEFVRFSGEWGPKKELPDIFENLSKSAKNSKISKFRKRIKEKRDSLSFGKSFYKDLKFSQPNYIDPFLTLRGNSIENGQMERNLSQPKAFKLQPLNKKAQNKGFMFQTDPGNLQYSASGVSLNPGPRKSIALVENLKAKRQRLMNEIIVKNILDSLIRKAMVGTFTSSIKEHWKNHGAFMVKGVNHTNTGPPLWYFQMWMRQNKGSIKMVRNKMLGLLSVKAVRELYGDPGRLENYLGQVVGKGVSSLLQTKELGN